MERLNKNFARAQKLCPLREEYPVRVLQFGEGNFLRAFIDWFIDILNEKTDFAGRVLLIQPTPHGVIARQAQQDFLYTLLLRGVQNGKTHNEKRIISCIAGGIDPYNAWDEFLQSACIETLRFIFSNTTEAGIVYEQCEPPLQTGICPSSFPAKLTAWLYKRFCFFSGDAAKGCVIIPCELIEANAVTLKTIIQKHAIDWKYKTEFMNWLDVSCVFINSLVDRVVAGFPQNESAQIYNELGYEDTLLDVGEYFHLCVLEADEKLEQELPFYRSGLNVILTNDIKPYRALKVRLLNGAHTAVSIAAYLAGRETVAEYTNDAVIGGFLRKVIYNELMPTVPLEQSICKEFADAVLERFANPFIHHKCLSIALNSVSKYKVRILPSLCESTQKNGMPPEGLICALAALVTFYHIKKNNDGKCFGITEDGREYPIIDDESVLCEFEKIWSAYSKHGDEGGLSSAVLQNKVFWDNPIDTINGLQKRLKDYLVLIAEQGIMSALQKAGSNSL